MLWLDALLLEAAFRGPLRNAPGFMTKLFVLLLSRACPQYLHARRNKVHPSSSSMMDGLLSANNRYLGQHDVQVVEQFLTEISSLHPDNRVFLVGTTNHPEDIDTRVLRGGRFSEKLTIPLPNASIEYSFSIAFSRAPVCSMN